ncbi:phosphoribosylaminoimidazolesuccinocarboxamide synthase [Streptomyces sp. 7R007]
MSSPIVPGIRPEDVSDDELAVLRERREPDVQGKSKKLWLLSDGLCLIEIIPSLRSFTYERDEIVADTGPLRLDFYERAAARLAADGVRTAFTRRVSPLCYLAEYCPAAPFEVIVKNRAVGSTLVKYPGLFTPEQVLPRPVVKFDYRTDPEDQPIGEDYLRALELPVDEWTRIALEVNESLRSWLRPVEVWDFCLIFGTSPDGEVVLISEVSQDCMRLRHADGSSLDKDLFRKGAGHEEIVQAWRRLFDELG